MLNLDPLEIGKKIREYRTSRGMTQKQLANLAHVNIAYISLMERGKREASIAELKRIAASLGCSEEVFLCDDDLESEEEKLWEKSYFSAIFGQNYATRTPGRQISTFV